MGFGTRPRSETITSTFPTVSPILGIFRQIGPADCGQPPLATVGIGSETEAPEKPTSRQRKTGLFTQPLIRLSATPVRAYLILSQVNSAITNLPSAPLGCALLEI